MCDLGNRFNINHQATGVGDALDEHGFGFRTDGGFYILRIGDIRPVDVPVELFE